MEATRSIDRLGLEMDLLWGPDAYGRMRWPHPLVVIARADDGQAVRFGPTVPDELIRSSREEDLSLDEGESGSRFPSALARCLESLRPLGSLRYDGGASYVFAKPPPLRGASTSNLRILTSEDGNASVLARLRPELWGEPGEWAELLAGRLGPWAIGMAGERVASVCYTPVASSHAAEAGIWTHHEERGRGWAPRVTAAWARAARSRFDTLFYSTGFDNAASQAVARKLELRPIGAIWRIWEDVS